MAIDTLAMMIIYVIGPTVQKISEAALDELIQTSNNKMVITFMAAWCGPCIDELPALNRLYKKFNVHSVKMKLQLKVSLEKKPILPARNVTQKAYLLFPSKNQNNSWN